MSDEESPLLSSDGGGELDDGYGDIGPEPESSKLSEEELKAAGGVVGFRFREMLKVLVPKQDEYLRSDDDAKLESEQSVATFAKHLEGVEHVSVRFPKTIPDSASRLLAKQIRAGKYSALSFVEVGTSTYDKTVFSKPFKSIARKGYNARSVGDARSFILALARSPSVTSLQVTFVMRRVPLRALHAVAVAAMSSPHVRELGVAIRSIGWQSGYAAGHFLRRSEHLRSLVLSVSVCPGPEIFQQLLGHPSLTSLAFIGVMATGSMETYRAFATLVASLPSLVHLDLRWDSHRSGTQGNDLALAPIVEAVERSEHIVQVLTNPVDDGLDALRARLDKVVGRNRQRREEAAQCVADCSGLPPGLRAIIMAYAFAAVPLLAEAAGAGASEGKEA